MGLFISFEGGEGCGKSTQAKRLATQLRRRGYDVLLTYEPGGTPLGEELRRCLKKLRDEDIGAESELLLFAAARNQLTRTRILPVLARGGIVVCDRYSDSTVAYQAYGRGLPMDVVATVNRIADAGVRPDLVVLLDMDPAEALQRKKQVKDRFEDASSAFHKRVRSGYRELAKAEADRWLVLNAAAAPSATARSIWARVEQLLKTTSGLTISTP